MKLIAIGALAAASQLVEAGMLRFACSQLVTESLDPIVNPGANPSPHMHQIVGGNMFNATMDPANDIGNTASCTTCTFSEDFSNYWTPVLYFRATNGSFKRVPQMANQYLDGENGGSTVYYVSPTSTTVNVTAFKPGFRMVVGDATLRKPGAGFSNLFRCYNGTNFQPNPYGVASTDTQDLPKDYCAGGIRVNTFFPTCWNGKDLDSPDHKSHVAYPSGGQDAACPADFPVQIPQVFIETVWDTGKFDKSMWPANVSQPFVFSQGDPTGYGHHADYVFGWKGDSLQKAMDARCDVGSCPELKTQTMNDANNCTLKQTAVADLDAWLPTLPGNMPVTTS